jgi:alpha-beta hydrolase superfamily lysophospholipase
MQESSSRDSAHGKLRLVDALVDRPQLVGVYDVTPRIFPEARHEVFNETNCDEV